MTLSLIDRRRVEAETFHAVYRELLQSHSERFAVETLARTVSALAFAAGSAFAVAAPHGPELAHFATIVDVWNGSGNLELQDVRLNDKQLSFRVVRCAYVDLYREMLLPPELIPVLSCARDAPFARGYSRRLRFFRDHTIADGANYCDFLFRWE